MGFDINKRRLTELEKGYDSTKEVKEELLKKTHNISFTDDENKLCSADVFIITVPTPIDKFNNPDLSFLKKPLLQLEKL